MARRSNDAELKRTDDPVDGIVLLLAAYKNNRDAIAGNRALPGHRLTFRSWPDSFGPASIHRVHSSSFPG